MELTLETSLGIEALSFISFPKHEFLLHFFPFLASSYFFLVLILERAGGRDDTTDELSVCERES